MKKSLLVLATALVSFTKFGAEPVDRIGVKGPLTFNKATFKLAWTSKPSDNYYIQEYLPNSETSDHFNQMLSIFLLVADIKTNDAVQQKIKELNERKKMTQLAITSLIKVLMEKNIWLTLFSAKIRMIRWMWKNSIFTGTNKST